MWDSLQGQPMKSASEPSEAWLDVSGASVVLPYASGPAGARQALLKSKPPQLKSANRNRVANVQGDEGRHHQSFPSKALQTVRPEQKQVAPDDAPRGTFFPEEAAQDLQRLFDSTNPNGIGGPSDQDPEKDYFRKLEDLLSTENFMSQPQFSVGEVKLARDAPPLSMEKDEEPRRLKKLKSEYLPPDTGNEQQAQEQFEKDMRRFLEGAHLDGRERSKDQHGSSSMINLNQEDDPVDLDDQDPEREEVLAVDVSNLIAGSSEEKSIIIVNEPHHEQEHEPRQPERKMAKHAPASALFATQGSANAADRR